MNHSNKLYFKLFPCFLFAAVILSSCNNSETNTPVAENQKADSVAAKDSSTESHLLSLPAPMQIATSIKRTNAKFQDNFLCPIKNNLTTNFSKAIRLGIYGVDLGYANVYDQKQTAINYFSTSLKLADEMKIIFITEPGIIKRFTENINNNDSVTYYTLSSFSKIHNNLLTSKRSDEAYTILAGSFIEGASLCCKTYDQNKDKKVGQLIAHQKLFLENIMELLSDCKDNKDLLDLSNQLSGLKTAYDKVEISYLPSNDPTSKTMMPVAISDDNIKEIETALTSIRNNIIK